MSLETISLERLKNWESGARRLRLLEDAKFQQASLIEFLKGGWKYIDPAPYVGGWHLEAIAEHLQAVADGHIRRLIINVPPRSSKSSLVSVAWPAWVWAQEDGNSLSGPHVQFLFASYAQSLGLRDSVKTRRLIESPWYQERWGNSFSLTGDQNTKIRFENNQGGYRLATSVGGALTGEGGSIIVVDDPINANEALSDAVRESTLSWWDESMSTRLNDPKTGAYVVIMQRLHEQDLTGHILANNHDEWVHLCLPMRYESDRHCTTVIGWEDPRTEDGELLCPNRFGEPEVVSLERALQAYGTAGQLQQRPSPRGGGIFKTDWWQSWEAPDGNFPGTLTFKIASLDPAYTEKEENDPSGFSVWGVFEDKNGNPAIMLLCAWRKRLDLHGPYQDRRRNETNSAFRQRTAGDWGLVEWVAHECRRLKVDKLLIESKASGLSVAQELRRLYANDDWGVELVNPKGDKVARAYAVQHLFSEGLIWAPIYVPEKNEQTGKIEFFNRRAWVETIIDEAASFPKGRYDDLVDSMTQALSYLRKIGLAVRREERKAYEESLAQHKSRNTQPLYPV